MKPNSYSSCQRRVNLSLVVGVTSSRGTGEFVIHVPDEYDYRYSSPAKADLLRVLADVYNALPGKADANLVHISHLDGLAGVTFTKDQSKLSSREYRQKLKDELLQRSAKQDKDEEERDSKDKKFTQLMNSTFFFVVLFDVHFRLVYCCIIILLCFSFCFVLQAKRRLHCMTFS